MIRRLSIGTLALGAVLLFTGLTLAPVAAQRYDPWEWDGNYQRLVRLNAGTYISARTTDSINLDRRDERFFPAVVEEDVWDDYGRLSVPAIPRGSRVDLAVRDTGDGNLILDLDSIYANGQRYSVSAAPERIEGVERDRSKRDTAAYIGGGALLGTIIGAIAGGGKGAAIGAAAGAATGYGISYRGKSIRVPAGSVLTFRLADDLTIGGDTRGTSGSSRRPYRNR